MDMSIGVYVIDRFTYYTLEFLESVNQNSKKTLYELVSNFSKFRTLSLLRFDVCFIFILV